MNREDFKNELIEALNDGLDDILEKFEVKYPGFNFTNGEVYDCLVSHSKSFFYDFMMDDNHE